MKYFVTFQYLPKHAQRPIDHASASDFEFQDSRSGLIPNVGDYVEIIRVGTADLPQYSGRVRSRLFRYVGADNCGVNIVVEEDDKSDWGKVIKE